MKTVIGVYQSHEDAINSVKALKNAGFTDKQISVIGKINKEAKETDVAAEDDSKLMTFAGTEVGITTIAGSTLGILTGLGIFAIPGLGFLYGAGALVGAIAGFDFGVIGGAIISALTLPGMKNEVAKEYETELKSGKTLVIVHGKEEVTIKAAKVLSESGNYLTLESH